MEPYFSGKKSPKRSAAAHAGQAGGGHAIAAGMEGMTVGGLGDLCLPT